MIEPLEVKTVEIARERSLVKWKRIKAFSSDLFNELDSACGFCHLGRYRAFSERTRSTASDELPILEKCEYCGVDQRCDKILKKSNKLEEKLSDLIDETITFLEEMDVKEK